MTHRPDIDIERVQRAYTAAKQCAEDWLQALAPGALDELAQPIYAEGVHLCPLCGRQPDGAKH